MASLPKSCVAGGKGASQTDISRLWEQDENEKPREAEKAKRAWRKGDVEFKLGAGRLLTNTPREL